MSVVQTVTGPCTADDLGVTQMHEHLISDFTMYLPPEGEADPFCHQSVCIGNLYEMKTRLMNVEVLSVNDRDTAVHEVAGFALAGGRTVVDATSIGIGRNPQALRAVSEATGVNVVMGSGWYVVESMNAGFAERSVESLAEEIVADLLEGVGDSGVRAGMIGEVGLSWPHHPLEERSLQAACIAQQRTGVALQIHPGRHPESPFLAMEAVRRFGADPTRTIICHVERTLTGIDEMLALAATGCMLEFDLFGQESSYYFVPSFTGMPNDAGRVRFLDALISAGHADQLLVSQDICTCVHLTRYGGEGLHHLLHRAVPLMRRMGMSDDDVRRLLVCNPARVLTGAEPSAPAGPPPSLWSPS